MRVAGIESNESGLQIEEIPGLTAYYKNQIIVMEKKLLELVAVYKVFKDPRLVIDNVYGHKEEDILGMGACRHNYHHIVLFDECLNLFYTERPLCKNHEIEELKLSVRIAKKCCDLNPYNKYYEEQLIKIKQVLDSRLSND